MSNDDDDTGAQGCVICQHSYSRGTLAGRVEPRRVRPSRIALHAIVQTLTDTGVWRVGGRWPNNGQRVSVELRVRTRVRLQVTSGAPIRSDLMRQRRRRRGLGNNAHVTGGREPLRKGKISEISERGSPSSLSSPLSAIDRVCIEGNNAIMPATDEEDDIEALVFAKDSLSRSPGRGNYGCAR